jgi:hypothetical protein
MHPSSARFHPFAGQKPRRWNVGGGVMAAVAAVLLVLAPFPSHAAPGQVNHVVVFWMKNPQSTADRAAIARASRSFRSLPGVVRVEVGRPLPVRRPGIEQSFDLSVIITFRDRTALARFASDPRHTNAVRSVLKPLVKRYIVFDSVLE